MSYPEKMWMLLLHFELMVLFRAFVPCWVRLNNQIDMLFCEEFIRNCPLLPMSIFVYVSFVSNGFPDVKLTFQSFRYNGCKSTGAAKSRGRGGCQCSHWTEYVFTAHELSLVDLNPEEFSVRKVTYIFGCSSSFCRTNVRLFTGSARQILVENPKWNGPSVEIAE